MGKAHSKLKKEGSRFQPPIEDRRSIEGEFYGGKNQTLPKELLENKDSETWSTRDSEYALSEYSNDELPLPKAKEGLELEQEASKYQGLTQHDSLATIYEKDDVNQESNSEGSTNATFVHLSCNTTPNTYPVDSKVVASLCGDYPKTQNPIHVLYGTQVKMVVHTMDNVGCEHGRVHVHAILPDIWLFSCYMEMDCNEALVK